MAERDSREELHQRIDALEKEVLKWKRTAGALQESESRLRAVLDNSGAVIELEQRIKERTADLVRANERLKNEIEDRERVEKALGRSEERFRKIFENLKDVYFETTLDGRIIISSPSGADFSGYSLEELIGNNVDMLYFNPEDREGLLKELSAQGKVREFKMVFKKKDGAPYDVSINADLYFDEEGRPAGMTGTIRDVTEEKRFQEKIQHLKKMESIGLMAGGIAHDLNNILSGIVSYPDYIAMKLPPDSPLKKPLRIIKESGQRAVGVVSDLLTVAKGVAVGREVMNLNALIRDFLTTGEECMILRNFRQVAIQQELSDDLLNISCSPAHINKILMNLLLNAAEAIQESGRISIKTANCYLEKPLHGYGDIERGEYVMLSVTDTGPGISGEDLERIFEPFYSKKMLGRIGTGLGLTIVWNTVQEHNGYIDVGSCESGTTFDLYFPATRQKVVKDDKRVDLLSYRGNGEHVLVIDDEPYQREIACDLLEALGYTAAAVPDGEAALAYLKKQAADILLLDMIMSPGMGGRETYEKIIAIRPGQKAVIVSGYSESEEVRAAQRLGAGKYVRKPYTLEKIGAAVKEELHRSPRSPFQERSSI